MKAAWEPEYHRVFVDLCLEQKMLGNQPGTQHILKPFQQRTGARFTRKQLKNHWDTMIKQWKIWCRLVQCSDMKWDPVTNMFGASDQDWSNYLEVNPEAGQYRLNPPLFLKKLEVIFEDSTFDDEVTPGWKRKRVCKHRDEDYDTGDDDEEEEEEDTQSASNFTSPQSKGYWSPSSHELFVDLLFQEALKGNRPDSHYPKETWKMMLETIKQNTGKSFTRPQLKNHWDCTRKGWKIWCQVIGDPMMKWDADTRTFGATDEDWKSYLKVNHRAAVFRRKHILHADKLATIFKGLIEPGKAYFRRYRRRVGDHHHHPESPQLHDPTPLSTLYTNEPVTGSEDRADNDDGDDDDDDEPTLQDMRFDGVGFAESRLQDVEIVTPGSHRFSTELSEKIPVNASVKKYEYTIGECIECLDNMEEVEQGSDLYMFALDLFPTKEYREIFLLLKNSSLRLSWLLRRQSGGLTITA